MKPIVATALFAALARGASALPADPSATAVYTWREADGTVVYSQFPPGQTSGIRAELRTLPLSATADGPGPARGLASETSADPLSTHRASAELLREADRQLAAARRAAAQGREPRPGERIGTVSHHSRLAPAYFERQRRLADAVRRAEAALAKAQAGVRVTSIDGF